MNFFLVYSNAECRLIWCRCRPILVRIFECMPLKTRSRIWKFHVFWVRIYFYLFIFHQDLTPYTTAQRNSETIQVFDRSKLRSSHGQTMSQRRLSELSNRFFFLVKILNFYRKIIHKRYSLFAVVNHTGSTESGK